MLFELNHETNFHYSAPITESVMEFRLTPITDASQHLLRHRQKITPNRPIRQYLDCYGNTVSYVSLQQPHTEIRIVSESLVETVDQRAHGASLKEFSKDDPAVQLVLYDFTQPTALTPYVPEFLDWVDTFTELRGAPARESAEVIRRAIFENFTYQGDVTDSHSTIEDVLELGAGVCQDFTHLMIAAMRYLGVPARYVSGYVLSQRAEENVYASHAWVEVFDHGWGWIGVDPTHDTWVEDLHIRLGVGRDYRDVSPNRGVYRGLATEEVSVRVHLRPLEPGELEGLARTLFQKEAPGFATRQVRKPQPVSILQQTASAQQQQQQQQ